MSARSEGERWTEEALAALRAGRFTPRAWRAFVASSLARASRTRAERPGLAPQARRWSLAATAAALVARRGAGAPPPRAAVLGWSALSAAMLEWHLGMAEDAAGGRRARLSSADAVTLARVWAVPFAARGSDGPTLAALGALSDLLDGALARRAGATRLGRDLDTLADLLFYGALAQGLHRRGRLGRGALRVVRARYGTALAAGALSYFATGRRGHDRLFGDTRWTAALHVGGLVLAAAGRRRAGGALIEAGALAGLASVRAPAQQAKVGDHERHDEVQSALDGGERRGPSREDHVELVDRGQHDADHQRDGQGAPQVLRLGAVAQGVADARRDERSLGQAAAKSRPA